MNRKPLTKDIISYLRLSSMEEKERNMWMFLLPHMELKHLKKLDKVLKDEASERADLLIDGYNELLKK